MRSVNADAPQSQRESQRRSWGKVSCRSSGAVRRAHRNLRCHEELALNGKTLCPACSNPTTLTCKTPGQRVLQERWRSAERWLTSISAPMALKQNKRGRESCRSASVVPSAGSPRQACWRRGYRYCLPRLFGGEAPCETVCLEVRPPARLSASR